MASFVLEPVSPGIWTGKAGAKVCVSVRSVNGNATTLHDAAYPDGTAINVAAGNACFNITDDGNNHTLDVAIIPPAFPDDWSLVEIAPDETTQDLLDVLAGQSVGAIIIQPS